MIKSMTAYARSEVLEGKTAVQCEIRTYNSRHLDLALRIAHPYTPLEDRVKSVVSGAIERGRVELRLKISDPEAAVSRYEVNLPQATAYMGALQRLKTATGVSGQVELAQLAAVSGVITAVEEETDVEPVWAAVESCLRSALERIDGMRLREGRHLAEDLRGRLDAIETRLSSVARLAAELPGQIQARLCERITALTHGNVELDPARMAQEAAFLADRSDVSEEIVRAESHLKQFDAAMDGPDACGRKLNFLLQELNREFNTMGAKVGDASAAQHIVAVKSELEKLREQVQNIE
jgi:uncharacterized protein (TIGR00255 family)